MRRCTTNIDKFLEPISSAISEFAGKEISSMDEFLSKLVPYINDTLTPQEKADLTEDLKEPVEE